MRRYGAFGLFFVLLVSLGCGAAQSSGFALDGDGGDDASSGSSTTPDGGGGQDGGTGIISGDGGSTGTFGEGGGPGGGPGSNCASGAGTFIYVISDTNELYTFDPTKFPSAAAFTLVGKVTCDNSGVNSMAVDRSATAWVNFNSGAIYKVTTTAPVTCTATGFTPGQGGFTNDLGMGFSLDAVGSNNETLFVADNGGPGGNCTQATPGPGCNGRGLGTINTTTMALTPLGAFTGMAAGYNAELTGTGAGKLYGFFTTSPGAYGPINKANGATSSPAPTSIPAVNASTGGYAFSFWGGDFFFYTAPTNNTIVTRLATATGTTTTSPELSFVIVGAGVSTCAPTTTPTQ
jgi:hypothetical protein